MAFNLLNTSVGWSFINQGLMRAPIQWVGVQTNFIAAHITIVSPGVGASVANDARFEFCRLIRKSDSVVVHEFPVELGVNWFRQITNSGGGLGSERHCSINLYIALDLESIGLVSTEGYDLSIASNRITWSWGTYGIAVQIHQFNVDHDISNYVLVNRNTRSHAPTINQPAHPTHLQRITAHSYQNGKDSPYPVFSMLGATLLTGNRTSGANIPAFDNAFINDVPAHPNRLMTRRIAPFSISNWHSRVATYHQVNIRNSVGNLYDILVSSDNTVLSNGTATGMSVEFRLFEFAPADEDPSIHEAFSAHADANIGTTSSSFEIILAFRWRQLSFVNSSGGADLQYTAGDPGTLRWSSRWHITNQTKIFCYNLGLLIQGDRTSDQLTSVQITRGIGIGNVTAGIPLDQVLHHVSKYTHSGIVYTFYTIRLIIDAEKLGPPWWPYPTSETQSTHPDTTITASYDSTVPVAGTVFSYRSQGSYTHRGVDTSDWVHTIQKPTTTPRAPLNISRLTYVSNPQEEAIRLTAFHWWGQGATAGNPRFEIMPNGDVVRLGYLTELQSTTFRNTLVEVKPPGVAFNTNVLVANPTTDDGTDHTFHLGIIEYGPPSVAIVGAHFTSAMIHTSVKMGHGKVIKPSTTVPFNTNWSEIHTGLDAFTNAGISTTVDYVRIAAIRANTNPLIFTLFNFGVAYPIYLEPATVPITTELDLSQSLVLSAFTEFLIYAEVETPIIIKTMRLSGETTIYTDLTLPTPEYDDNEDDRHRRSVMYHRLWIDEAAVKFNQLNWDIALILDRCENSIAKLNSIYGTDVGKRFMVGVGGGLLNSSLDIGVLFELYSELYSFNWSLLSVSRMFRVLSGGGSGLVDISHHVWIIKPPIDDVVNYYDASGGDGGVVWRLLRSQRVNTQEDKEHLSGVVIEFLPYMTVVWFGEDWVVDNHAGFLSGVSRQMIQDLIVDLRPFKPLEFRRVGSMFDNDAGWEPYGNPIFDQVEWDVGAGSYVNAYAPAAIRQRTRYMYPHSQVFTNEVINNPDNLLIVFDQIL